MDPNQRSSIVKVTTGGDVKHMAVPDDAVDQLKQSMVKAQANLGDKAKKTEIEVIESGIPRSEADKKVKELNAKMTKPGAGTGAAPPPPADETQDTDDDTGGKT